MNKNLDQFENQIRDKLENFQEYPPDAVLGRIKSTIAAEHTPKPGNKLGWWIGITAVAVLLAGTIYFTQEDVQPQKEIVVVDTTHSNSVQNAPKTDKENTSQTESKNTDKKDNLNIKGNLHPNAGEDAVICGLSTKLNASLSVKGSVGRWVTESSSISFISSDFKDPKNDPNALLTVKEYGAYTLRWMESLDRNQSFDEIKIQFRKVPEVSLGEDQVICGYEVELNSKGTRGFWKGEPGLEVTNPNESVTKIKSVQAGSFNLVWTEMNGACQSSDTLLVTFIDQPIAKIKVSTQGDCFDSPIHISCEYHDDYQYEWDFDQARVHHLKNQDYLISYNQQQEHMVKLRVSHKETCVSYAEVQVKLPPRILADYEMDRLSSHVPSLVYFNNRTNQEDLIERGPIEYQWDFGDGSISNDTHTEHLYTRPGVYSVQLIAKDVFGCADTVKGETFTFKSITSVSGAPQFSPNGDGINDTWKIDIQGLTDFHCIVMNRSGRKVYESTEALEEWDGRINGSQIAEQGHYLYLIRGKDDQGKLKEFTGTIYLIRSN